jgi:hypothetical protein
MRELLHQVLDFGGANATDWHGEIVDIYAETSFACWILFADGNELVMGETNCHAAGYRDG